MQFSSGRIAWAKFAVFPVMRSFTVDETQEAKLVLRGFHAKVEAKALPFVLIYLLTTVEQREKCRCGPEETNFLPEASSLSTIFTPHVFFFL